MGWKKKSPLRYFKTTEFLNYYLVSKDILGGGISKFVGKEGDLH